MAAVSKQDVGVRLRRFHSGFFLAAALLYGGSWALADVAFLAHRFPLPFLTGAAFYRRFSHTIGGPVQYAAGFFTQTYSTRWAGTLALTVLALAAWAVARGILRRFSVGPCTWPAAAFAAIVLTLASRSLSVLFILPAVAGLAVAWLYVAVRERLRGGWLQAVVVLLFLLATVPLYCTLASGFLFLCVVAALFELIVARRPAWVVAWLACGAAVPYGMNYVLYEPEVADRYVRWLRIPGSMTVADGMVIALYLFVPLGAVVASLVRRFRLAARLPSPARLAVRVAGFAVLALLASRLVALQYDRGGWLYADHLREEGKAGEALASLSNSQDGSEPARFVTFYALALSGRLPWDMFHYPQVASSDELLLRDAKWDTVAGIADWRSDLYLDLGRVNEAQRWAHEALAVEGETPRVLERLAQVYLLNDNPDAARTFLHALADVPFQGARARRYLADIGRDPRMSSDPVIARVRPLMLRRDYVGTWTTEQLLQQCLDANPSNRIAFEYLVAHYLLTSDLKGFASVAPRLKDFYRQLPTHVQEALLGYKNENGALPPGIDAAAIDAGIALQFGDFIQVFTRYQNEPEALWKALAPRFGSTWWFFYIFGRTEAGPPPDARAGASSHVAAGSQ